MPKELRILFIEDSPEDAELEENELRQAGLGVTCRRVETRDALEEALVAFKPDVVISDYSMPRLDGLVALKITREIRPDLPFLFVSGTIGEERAIESLKNGATDYLVKDSLAGLVPKIRRALKEMEETRERRKLEEQLRQSQKMEAVGRLAGGVAHDFNNLLTVINGYSELLLRRFPKDDPDRVKLQEIYEAGRRAAGLTRQLLTFSRRRATEARPLDLANLIAGVERMLSRLVGEHIPISTHFQPGLWTVLGDAGQIEQVVVNLVVNARDAMPSGGKVAIEAKNVELDEAYAQSRSEVRPGPHVLLSVSDTGCGMDEEVLSHLFEPFFTTKEAGKGTGLGLSTVYGIVKQAGGHIGVYSEVGRGTTFKVYLPRHEALKEDLPKAEKPATPARRSSATVLLAEDSEVVRRLTVQILEGAGYTVLAAAHGEAGLETLNGHPGKIDLLITDTVMPGLQGPELALHASRLRPGIKVLFVSGYTEMGARDQGVPTDTVSFLEKPFTGDTLLRKVREVLGGIQAS